MRTIPDIGELLQPLEHAIRHKFIPVLTEGRSCSDDERILLSLPVRLGGLGIINPVVLANIEFENSKLMTESLTHAIRNQTRELPDDFDENSKICKLRIRSARRTSQRGILEDHISRMNE